MFSGGSVELTMACVVLVTISTRDNKDDEVAFGVKLGKVVVVVVVVDVVVVVVVVVVGVVVVVLVVVVADLGGQPRSQYSSQNSRVYLMNSFLSN